MANNILDALNDLIDALNRMANCCSEGGVRGGGAAPPPELGAGDVDIGIDGQFPDQSSYLTAKCLAANTIYDYIYAKMVWLRDNEVDLVAGVFGGLTAGIAIQFATGPLGWAAIAIEAITAGVAALIIAYELNFDDLCDNLADVKSEIINGMYNAGSVAAAKASWLAAMDSGTPSVTAVEKALISYLLVSVFLNELFSPSSETLAYTPPSPTTCTGAGTVWTFAASDEGWTFQDDSTGAGYSASGAWETEQWIVTMIGTGSVTKQAKGTIYKTGLSIAVDVGQSVQFDFGPTSDGVNSSKWIDLVYDDASEFHAFVSGGASAGTIVLDITEAGNIEEIYCSLSRKWTSGFNFTRAITEVRVT